MKHTPGEWKVKDNGKFLEVRGANNILKPNIYVFPFEISGCLPEDYCNEAETLANAKLIAAAPDLLKALQGLYHAVKDIPEVKDYLDGNLIEAAESIKKATEPFEDDFTRDVKPVNEELENELTEDERKFAWFINEHENIF